MSVFSASIKENISSMFKQSEIQIDEYKKIFNDNIDTLNIEIESILNKLAENTKESETIEKKVRENKELAAWIENKEAVIKTLLTF